MCYRLEHIEMTRRINKEEKCIFFKGIDLEKLARLQFILLCSA